ncbi:MAG TPA: metalloregulator ArsR/SmtB family transcription factor [Chloroflexota bacterium]|nr:metalloregulator ArsR/SmtB family transcription factor [Chloroflexota bacterium]
MSVETNLSAPLLLDFFKALADESRLRLVGLLAISERSVDELATLLELRAPTVSHHLKRLKALDLVSMRAQGTSHVYRLNIDALHALSREALSVETLGAAAVAPAVSAVGADAWDRKVLRDFLIAETLKEIPASRKKRDVVLRWLVERFANDRRYTEKEVNAVLVRHHPDVATLRRELVGANLMQRANNVYWRV